MHQEKQLLFHFNNRYLRLAVRIIKNSATTKLDYTKQSN